MGRLFAASSSKVRRSRRHLAVVTAFSAIPLPVAAQDSGWTMPAYKDDDQSAASTGKLTPESPAGPPATRTAPNALYFELLGSGGLYSINYDRIVADRFALRIGFSAFEFCLFTCTSVVTAPVTASYLVGEGSHSLELGIGLLGVSSDSDGTVVGTGVLGYRFQPLDGGVVFRFTATPFFGRGLSDDGKFEAVPWVGSSIGGAF
jgi:hypothetical protein